TAIPAFLERYPGIRVVASMTDRMLDIVAEGIDVAVRLGRLSDSTLKARKIGTSRRVVCASKDYLKKHGRPKTPADLEQHACVTWREHPGHNVWEFKSSKGVEKIKVTGPFFALSSDSLVAAAVAGMGLVLLPDWNLGEELRTGKLKIVLSDYELSPQTTPIWAVHAHDRFVPPKIRVFIDFLIERFAEQRFS
ncbi:MAG: substrate binding domain-containing protein, partial [Gammaproteobacteria bacterium]|nr:substrate binding domain-containing protein [Gammaproteobacteria bacterium]